MYLCMFVRMYVCMCVCVYVCMYACMYVCMYEFMNTCMHACMHVSLACTLWKAVQSQALPLLRFRGASGAWRARGALGRQCWWSVGAHDWRNGYVRGCESMCVGCVGQGGLMSEGCCCGGV